MDEFFGSATKYETGVAPLVFGGGRERMRHQYAQPVVCGILRVRLYRQRFYEINSPEIYHFTEGRQKVYETPRGSSRASARKGHQLLAAPVLYSAGAQREFIQGHAAMDICGNWFPTEMTAYLKGYPDFEFGYMPVPHINADQKDYAGKDSSKVRYSLDGNILAIPASSQYKTIAKDFLLSMYTKESYQSFVGEQRRAPPDERRDRFLRAGCLFKGQLRLFQRAETGGRIYLRVQPGAMAVNDYSGSHSQSNTLGNLINASYEAAIGVAHRRRTITAPNVGCGEASGKTVISA
ncbi:MAG: hypothetical protein ACLRSW_05470 [Christensenellaceae bacterium]